jgi:hypothetical protein
MQTYTAHVCNAKCYHIYPELSHNANNCDVTNARSYRVGKLFVGLWNKTGFSIEKSVLAKRFLAGGKTILATIFARFPSDLQNTTIIM